MGIIYKNGVQYGGTVDAANMHVDIGSSTLNLQTAIQNITGRVAPIESNPTTHAYEIGDLLVFNGMLYEATAAISSGDTLVIGTNIASTTVSQNKIGYNDICNNLITNDLTKVASAATVKLLNDKNVAMTNNLTHQTFATSSYKATSTNYEYVNLTFTIPTSCCYLVWLWAYYTSGAPIGIILTTTNATPSAANTSHKFEWDSSNAVGKTPALILIGGTYYMWVKRATVPGSANTHAAYGVKLHTV